ncbi:LuxR C-terminal-related transcriptional regulator [Stigmatella aurantiaca]|uniref:Transcriptional regulator, LuxR family n=1 Tax=Stigmatella aurantiaca (strain DW4/3-1) TaxID=378806 RepID=Q099X7_STIAD|nr:LuxR C-terminal-related transcriptional regulator [Stigmatella aurantiaca]ADO73060.1 Transcriptional regulator, LuxR family [Stigmatella aurantiaca DW4/3-1]EAU68536.1 transcriptional regulator, LuxR family protein [Stigmatella aurantiaca DW4/3-1]
MASRLSLNARELARTLESIEVLNRSLNVSQVLASARQLLSVDYAALCISKPDRPAEYDWEVDLPVAFFKHYPEVASQDFVRQAVVRRPNVVLRDSQMVSLKDLQHNPMYQRFRDLGTPLERVMAVMLDVHPAWHGGVTLYRTGRQPFSEREQALLQRLTPHMVNALRNCRTFGAAEQQGRLLELLLRQEHAAYVVMSPPSTEVMRTPQATNLLETWFPSGRSPGALPAELLERLALEVSKHGTTPQAWPVWDREGTGRACDLRVTFIPLPWQGDCRWWALKLQEIPHAIPLPTSWRGILTAREAEVASCVLGGWENETIADALDCALETVKTHVKRILDKLGVDSRSALMAKAFRA